MGGKQVPGEAAAFVDGEGSMAQKAARALAGKLDPSKAQTVPERVSVVIHLKLSGQYHPGLTPPLLAQSWNLSLGRVKDIVEAATAAYAAIVREDAEAIRAQCLQNLRSLEAEARGRARVAEDRWAANFLAVAVKATETVARMADAELDRRFQREERIEKAEREERRMLTQGKAEFVVTMVDAKEPEKMGDGDK